MSSLPVDVLSMVPAEESDSLSSELRRLARLMPRPASLEGTGLSLTFLADLLGKHLASAGVLTTSQLVERLALAGPVLEQVLQFMRAEGRIEVRARVGQEAELRFGLTDRGRKEAADAFNRGGYVGPAPVPLDDYVDLVARQSVHREIVTRQRVLETFRGFVIDEDLRDRLGPALNSRRAMFLYGSAGTGKTYTARRLSRALRGLVLVPHAISVNETVIEMFDPLCHQRAAARGTAAGTARRGFRSALRRLRAAGGADRRRTRGRHARSAVRRRDAHLLGADPAEGQQRLPADRRPRPAAHRAGRAVQPLDRAARHGPRLADHGQGPPLRGAVRPGAGVLDQPAARRTSPTRPSCAGSATRSSSRRSPRRSTRRSGRTSAPSARSPSTRPWSSS